MPNWISATWDAPPNVRALTTLRDHGDAGQEHRRTLQSAIGLERLQWLDQVHGNRCLNASASSCGHAPEADAAWTSDAALGLVIQTADCVPVVLTEPGGDKIGAAHGGWRGLVSGVLQHLIAAMAVDGPLLAWIGPAIGPAVYEVGPDVFEAVTTVAGDASVFLPGKVDGKWYLDLFALTALLLAREGVAYISTERLCTYSDPRFYSYRRDGVTGRMATVIWKAR
jgi:hypothetical protein